MEIMQIGFIGGIGPAARDFYFQALYYSDNRTASNAVSELGMQLGVDMSANVLKELSPEFEHKFSRKHHRTPTN